MAPPGRKLAIRFAIAFSASGNVMKHRASSDEIEADYCRNQPLKKSNQSAAGALVCDKL